MAIHLRPYQSDLAHKATEIRDQYGISYLAMQVRTGKTLTSLQSADESGYKNVLFVTKIKAMPNIQADYEGLNPNYDITITNNHFSKLEAVNSRLFDHIIIDEGQAYGTYPKPSKLTIAAKKLCYGKPISILSGTPSPESYSQLYHQLSISDKSPFAKYPNFYYWAKAGFVNIKQKKVSSGILVNDYSDANGDMIWKYCKHLFIMFTQEEAGFKAPVDEIFLDVEMSAECQKIYRELHNHKIYQHWYRDRQLSATVNSGADLINKLSQISSGTLIFDDEPKGIIIDPAKAVYVKSYFYGKKIAIFYRFKAEFELLKSFFPNWTDNPESFNASNDLTFLCQMQSGREGVNLSTADALVAYNTDFSATTYFQMRARIQSKERIGTSPLYWIRSLHGIERKVYQAVSNKTNFTYSYYRKTMSDARKTNTTSNKIQAGTGGLFSAEANDGIEERLSGSVGAKGW